MSGVFVRGWEKGMVGNTVEMFLIQVIDDKYIVLVLDSQQVKEVIASTLLGQLLVSL